MYFRLKEKRHIKQKYLTLVVHYVHYSVSYSAERSPSRSSVVCTCTYILSSFVVWNEEDTNCHVSGFLSVQQVRASRTNVRESLTLALDYFLLYYRPTYLQFKNILEFSRIFHCSHPHSLN